MPGFCLSERMDSFYSYHLPVNGQTNPGDVMLNSVWSETTSIPQFPRLEGDVSTDVLIIGGGLAGILTASRLEKAGIRYLLIEADEICHGVTRNTTAKITAQHGLIYRRIRKEFGSDTARLYWEANEAAIAQYRLLSQKIPCDFEKQDAFVYSLNPTDKLEQELHTLQVLGIPGEFTRQIPLPFPVSGAVRFKNQAQFHPLKLAAGIAQGLNIRTHTRAVSIDGNTVATNHGTIKAQKIIVTTHFPLINTHGFYFLKLYQDRSYVLGLENAPNLKGMYRDEAAGGLSFRNAGDLLLLGGGGHRTGKTTSGWDSLTAAARQHFPNASVRYRWAAQDCITLDGIPYIGQYSKHTPNLYVATGFGKWGMTTAMVAATLLCDLIQGIRNPYTPVFSPARTVWRPQLFVNTAEVVKNLLTPTKPRCPHLGCALKWNPQEYSWDCPCHGSRFTEKGKLLDNPASGDLKQSFHPPGE